MLYNFSLKCVLLLNCGYPLKAIIKFKYSKVFFHASSSLDFKNRSRNVGYIDNLILVLQ